MDRRLEAERGVRIQVLPVPLEEGLHPTREARRAAESTTDIRGKFMLRPYHENR